MERYHSDYAVDTFRKLQPGQPPIGLWKYCSNWQEIWNDDFEVKDPEFKKGVEFETYN